MENVRRWATLTIFAEIGDKPRELFMTALTRARFCQKAGQTDHSGPGRLLDCVLAIERGDFEQADTIVPHAGEHYLESLTWTNATAKQLIG